MHRNQAGTSWQAKAIWFALTAGAAGAGLGAGLGVAGGLLSADARAFVATVLGGVALAIGGLELAGRRLSPPQRSCETPQRWIHGGALRWAVRNGVTLGSGVSTRIGFWSWYLIPLSALLLADPARSAVVYGSYGMGRGLGALGLIALFAMAERCGEPQPAVRVLNHRELARRVAAGQLLCVGAVLVVALG